MLESGCVSVKNEVNIMMKNIVDIVLGGFTYWLFGYGMSFGRGPLSNPFIAIGDFLLDPPAGDPLMGPIFGMPPVNRIQFNEKPTNLNLFISPQTKQLHFYFSYRSRRQQRPSSVEQWPKGAYEINLITIWPIKN